MPLSQPATATLNAHNIVIPVLRICTVLCLKSKVLYTHSVSGQCSHTIQFMCTTETKQNWMGI